MGGAHPGSQQQWATGLSDAAALWHQAEQELLTSTEAWCAQGTPVSTQLGLKASAHGNRQADSLVLSMGLLLHALQEHREPL